MRKQSVKLDKEDTLLLLLLALTEEGAMEKVRSITRIEKLMYLLQRETQFSDKLGDKFQFRPWKFGPFSREIYDAIDLLESLGLVHTEEQELASYVEYTERNDLTGAEQEDPIVEKVFSLTGRGAAVAEKLKSLIATEDWNEILKLKKRFERTPLTSLIQYVYHRYPETTDKSVLEHLKPRERAS